MGFMDKFRDKLKFGNEPDYEEEMEEETEQPGIQAPPRMSRPDNVVDIQSVAANATSANMRVVVIEPRSFDDVQQVANCLKEKKPVLVNFENTDTEEAKRIIDFLSGTTYALAGEIQKVGHNVFLCAPRNVHVAFSQERTPGTTDLPWMKK